MNAADNANPLLDFSGPTRFDAIRVEHVTPAVDRLISDARAAVDAVALDSHPATWDNVAEPLAEPLDRLDRAWGVVRHLNAVVSTPEWREAYHANLPKITAFHTDLAQDLRLFRRYRELAASPSFARLDAAKRRAVANELRDFRLGGAELPAREKARLKAVDEELAELSARFDDNVLDATNALGALRRRPERTGRRARCRARRSARRSRSRWQCRLEAHAAHAVLSAGAELRRQPRAARHAASRLRDARVGPGRVAGMGQRSGDPAPPRVAPRGGAAARLRAFCRGLAGAENGDERRRSARLPARSRAPRQAVRPARLRGTPGLRPDRARPRRARAVGPRLRVGEAQGEALCVLRTGNSLLFSGAQGARRAVPRGADALRHLDPRKPGADVARRRALLRCQRRVGRADRPVLPRQLRAAGQAGRRVAGRRRQSPPRGRAPPASGRVPHLQPVGIDRRRPRDVHARRSDHALPRIRPRPAPAAHARGGAGGLRHPGRRMGCRRAPQPVHGEFLLGMGRARAR